MKLYHFMESQESWHVVSQQRFCLQEIELTNNRKDYSAEKREIETLFFHFIQIYSSCLFPVVCRLWRLNVTCNKHEMLANSVNAFISQFSCKIYCILPPSFLSQLLVSLKQTTNGEFDLNMILVCNGENHENAKLRTSKIWIKFSLNNFQAWNEISSMLSIFGLLVKFHSDCITKEHKK